MKRQVYIILTLLFDIVPEGGGKVGRKERERERNGGGEGRREEKSRLKRKIENCLYSQVV